MISQLLKFDEKILDSFLVMALLWLSIVEHAKNEKLCTNEAVFDRLVLEAQSGFFQTFKRCLPDSSALQGSASPFISELIMLECRRYDDILAPPKADSVTIYI